LSALEREQEPEEYVDSIFPDGVLSGSKNTISPSHLSHRQGQQDGRCCCDMGDETLVAV